MAAACLALTSQPPAAPPAEGDGGDGVWRVDVELISRWRRDPPAGRQWHRHRCEDVAVFNGVAVGRFTDTSSAGPTSSFGRRMSRLPAVSLVHASLFGSAARADGDADSDFGLFLVRPGTVAEEDETWQHQTDELTNAVVAWTGNPLSIIEFSDERVIEMTRDALAPRLDDSVLLRGVSLAKVVGHDRVA